jgi:hypothetical protein
MAQKAVEAHLKAAECCEQKNELLLAAENYTSAAHLSNNSDKSVKLLLKANNFFKIEGQTERGTSEMKKVAMGLAGRDTPEANAEAAKILRMLLDEVFLNELAYATNADIVRTYNQLLLKGSNPDFHSWIDS